ncbi:methyltransf_25 domain-containing protein [Caerostris darwini]|uniref:Methyltransf_25 domain-containing protein n=1 Tax=Caerostris darwini TaxID=1538125 RepID=A0AAV4R6S7_9ARAC|nr:methyltransf_25 domain-containing protein [Caerostris darwini]
MDIGCEGGHISTSDLLKLFPDIQKVIAIDARLASEFYKNPKIEYHVADITKSSSLFAWKGKITKIISSHCFNCLRSFDKAFENVFDLLVPNGTAAIYFTLNSSYYTYFDEIIKKWIKFSNFEYQGLPAVQKRNLDAQYFEILAQKVGFDVVLCESVVQNLYFDTDLHCEVFLETTCPCGIPFGITDYFKKNLIETFRKYSERNAQNKITFKMTVLKMMLSKPS